MLRKQVNTVVIYVSVCMCTLAVVRKKDKVHMQTEEETPGSVETNQCRVQYSSSVTSRATRGEHASDSREPHVICELTTYHS